MERPLVVLDSNVIVSSLLNSHSAPSQVIALWRDYRYDLLLSSYILNEVKNTLNDKQLAHKYHISPIKQSRLLTQLIHAGKMIEFDFKSIVDVRDPKDSAIIQTALAGKANCLVTGDQDLLVLNGNKSIKTLQIVTPDEFLHLFMNSDDILLEYIEDRKKI